MKFPRKKLVAVAAIAVYVLGTLATLYYYFWPDGVYEDDIAIVKIYDNRKCQLPGLADRAKHATGKIKATGETILLCYVDAREGLMVFIKEGGGLMMAHRDMFQ